jgi:hypothetical protein
MQSLWDEAFPYNSIELFSPSGRLCYENGGNKVFWQGVMGNDSENKTKQLKNEIEIIGDGMKRYQFEVLEQLTKAMNGKPSYICTGEQGLATLNTMLQIIE